MLTRNRAFLVKNIRPQAKSGILFPINPSPRPYPAMVPEPFISTPRTIRDKRLSEGIRVRFCPRTVGLLTMMSPQDSTHATTSSTMDEVEYARALESLRIDLRGYVRSLLIDKDATDDVLQEVFVFLWERRHEFSEKLRPSAFRVAWFKALAYRRDRQREHLVHFSEEGLRRVAGAAEDIASTSSDRLDALRQCMGELASRELELLDLKYLKRQSLAGYARRHGQSPNSAQKALSRVRLALRKCIESKLAS